MLNTILAWLDTTSLTLWSTSMTWAECLGFLTGIVCVWLAARNNIWNFPVGITNGLLLFELFWRTRLFADATLQVCFILLNARGWWQWARHAGAPVLPITHTSGTHLKVALLCSAVGICALAVLLTLVRGSVPIFDASILALSLVAQWLMNHRKLQSWWWWMAVDVISIAVYIYKELYLIAVLYAVFLGLCVRGYRNWHASVHAPSMQHVWA